MSEPRVIKKYPNRRLYDTVQSKYITLADIRSLVLERIEFVVIDKKSQEDITRSILLQVIAEQEHGVDPVMSRDFLSQIIRSYGGNLQNMLSSYLEQSMKLFGSQQRELREKVKSVVGVDPVETVAGVAQGDAEHREVVAQRQAQQLEAHVGVHQGDELVAGAIALDLESGYDDPEVVLEALLGTERQPAHPRVQAVGADHEVELPPGAAAERDVHAAVVVDRLNRVAENGLDLSRQRAGDGCGEIGAGDGDIPVACTHEHRRRERRDPPPMTIDGAHLAEAVAAAPQLGDDAHPFRDVEARAPEVHGVTPAPRFRG